MRLLLVDDDELLNTALHDILVGEHYVVDSVNDCSAAWDYLSVYSYDLILLDVLLPGQDGINFCQELRSKGYSLPILLLSARDTSVSKIKGLDAGADDFVVKPFDIEELEARIRALLRRGKTESSPILRWGQLNLNPNQAEVTYEGQPISLSPKKYALLELLFRNHQQVVSFDKIMDSLWPTEECPGRDTVRSHIKELRHKLQAAGAPDNTIATIRGQGYRLQLPSLKASPEEKAPIAWKSQSVSAEYLAEHANIWEKYKSKFAKRLEVLAEAATRLKGNGLDSEFQQLAVGEAHSLVGTLGTFGLEEGSRLARQLESILQAASPDSAQATVVEALVSALRYEIVVYPAEKGHGRVPNSSPLVLIAGCDPTLTEQIVQKATAVNIRTAIASTSAEMRQAIAKENPSAVLIELSLLQDAKTEYGEPIAALQKQMPSVPLIAFGGDNLLGDRIEAARLGASTFLKPSVTSEQAFELILQQLRYPYAGAKIVVVDDDPELLEGVSMLLEPWGFNLVLVDKPRQFWEVLDAVKPDLVVLDYAMPHFSGIELCQAVRSDPDWNSLPILFLTANSDAETRDRVFAAGADDYLIKPVEATELANRILKRLHRKQS